LLQKAKRMMVFNEAVTRDQKECPICSEDYKEDDDIRMTDCVKNEGKPDESHFNHFYHRNCMVNWFTDGQVENVDKCPTCRATLKPISHPYFEELDKKLEPFGLEKKATLYIRGGY